MIQLKLIILVIFAAFLGAIGALFIKKSSGHITLNLKSIITNKNLLFGGVAYLISVIIYLYSLNKGELSVIYPLVSTTYIWTTLFSIKYLNEKINIWKIMGIVVIILGVIFIGIGS